MKSNEKYAEVYSGSRKVIESIANDATGPYGDFFRTTSAYLLFVMDHSVAIQGEDYYTDNDFETLMSVNHQLYEDIVGERYACSYVNPTYAVDKLGLEMGQLISSVGFLLRDYVGLAYEQRFGEMYGLNRLFIDLYDAIVVKGVTSMTVLQMLVRDGLIHQIDDKVQNNWVRALSPEFKTYSGVVDHYDAQDLRYLFRYGVYIGENEVKSAQFIASLEDSKVKKIADTYTEAYERGFVNKGIDLSKKASTLVTYQVGWERIVAKAYENFEALGLKPIVQFALRGAMRPRLYFTKPNRQMMYDHRFSDAIFFDETYVEALKLANSKALKVLEAEAEVYAGLALIEAFGEVPFTPENHEANMAYDDATRQLEAQYKGFLTAEYRKYVRGDDYSFTINTYPLPSIGKDYEGIFDEVIEVNTLDQKLYEDVQQKMIDALDQSTYAHILGAGDNETDLKVALQTLKDPSSETNFSNCTADVNVPVGEIFTTPQLEGTKGLLHVKDVYLKGLQYLELKIWFEDGMISKYSCENYEDEAQNLKYVLESLIHPHETLPLGEFAIGTNTVAYMMAKKYKINNILPILIGEKTGPHFAIGDTCYLWGEDNDLYNPDGKEIIAKDNAVSVLRKTDVSKAYMNKHTDITIPYNELGSIIGYDMNGGEYRIIENGRFVLDGTEILNEPFDR